MYSQKLPLVWCKYVILISILWFLNCGNAFTQGAIWAAQRVPDDEVTVAANGFRIRHMNLSDSDNFLASKNVVESAKKAGWYDPDKDGEFDFMGM